MSSLNFSTFDTLTTSLGRLLQSLTTLSENVPSHAYGLVSSSLLQDLHNLRLWSLFVNDVLF